MHKIGMGLMILSALVVADAAGAACRYSAPRTAAVDAAGATSLAATLGASDMHIHGVPGLAKVQVSATACASNQAWLRDLQVTAARTGAAVSITAQDAVHRGLFGAGYAYLKLDVAVPASLAVSVHTGSGDVDAARLAALDFTSGSGDLAARDIAGQLALSIGSADVEAERVGSVELHRTASGDVEVKGVAGNVNAQHSGSGDLEFSHVTGSVNVGSTGSGDIELTTIGGNIDVGSTGSGDVTVRDAGGDLRVGATGSGDVRYHGVKGKVSVPRRGN